MLALGLATSVAAVTAPHVPVASVEQLARPLPLPYDEAADGSAQVAAAKARAKASGKLLLIDLGGNWCPDCRVLAAIIDIPEV
ncbi:MAG: thioredoxin family protein, partial [Janthinobacterium lividum]